MSITAEPRNPQHQFGRLGLDPKSIWLIRLALPNGRPKHHRIVAKVDGLMTLCDWLEAQLATAQAESRRLMEAILYNPLTPTADLRGLPFGLSA